MQRFIRTSKFNAYPHNLIYLFFFIFIFCSRENLGEIREKKKKRASRKEVHSWIEFSRILLMLKLEWEEEN